MKSSRSKNSPVTLLIGTRKGAFTLKSDARRRTWKVSAPIFLGHIVHHLMQDPRESKRWLMACKTGHLGPTVFHSDDRGKTWKESKQPPAFHKTDSAKRARAVDHVFWLTPGHASEPGVWYAGTSPQGLFRSEDHGVTWKNVDGFNENPMYEKWTGGDKDGTPDGPKLHSIIVDPRNARHIYLGCSSGGVFETVDQGKTWTPLNKGCDAEFLPQPDPEYGHDPHCVQLHPLMPDRLYQQNHCGVYRMDRTEGRWHRIGKNLPKHIGDIGFSITLHPTDPDVAWVFPMDGTSVWPRTSPGGKPAVYATYNAGKTWKRLDKGFPKKDAYWTVFRQAMACDQKSKVGLYLGTTSGEVWGSTDEGRSWSCLVRHLPEIFSLEVLTR